MPVRRVSSLVVIAVLLVACPSKHTGRISIGSSPDGTFPVATDARVYRLVERADRFDAWAIATYRNRTGKTVYFARCKPDDRTPMYELRRDPDNGKHTTTVGGGWACVGGVPSGEVAPSGTVSVRVWLGSTKSPHAQPPDNDQDRIGTFRILLDLCTTRVDDSDHCKPLPDTERQSDTFQITFS